jgi:hypothetical protein
MHYSFSKNAESFIKTCRECGWILGDFDWGTWKDTSKAMESRDNPDAMARATPDKFAKLLTVLVRQERFCERITGCGIRHRLTWSNSLLR